MAAAAIIDALFCIPKNTKITQVSECLPFGEDLSPQMDSSGIAGAVIAPCKCGQCPNQWNCADRKTYEVRDAVKKCPKRLRGLASYDPLRVGDSLRWIDEALSAGELIGAYAEAECCVSGLHAARMYPLYGMCDKLRAPVVLDFNSRESWQHHRPQVEVLAADFPDLQVLLSTPPRIDATSMIRLMQRFQHVQFLLNPEEFQAQPLLCEFVEAQGRERVAFRANPQSWPAATQASSGRLEEAALHSYLYDNAAKWFGFAAVAAGTTAPGAAEGQ
jgi:predicted TIM-barrel fold metal-dependent hydrolase